MTYRNLCGRGSPQRLPRERLWETEQPRAPLVHAHALAAERHKCRKWLDMVFQPGDPGWRLQKHHLLRDATVLMSDFRGVNVSDER